MGHNGLWKFFGSTSTNHKHFEKPEEMGIEEDNIRKYTTPAYKAPEVEWKTMLFDKLVLTFCSKNVDSHFLPFPVLDVLFRREPINEKVDNWVSQLYFIFSSMSLGYDLSLVKFPVLFNTTKT